MKKQCFYIFLIVLFCYASIVSAQQVGQYPKGKIVLKNGNIVTGKNLQVSSEKATLLISGQTMQSYELADVNMIQAKQNKGPKAAGYAAGGCVALALLAYLVGDEETFTESYEVDSKSEAAGQYFLGAALWAGCLGGVGYLIGNASDPWQVVYTSSSSQLEIMNRVETKFSYQVTPSFIMGRYVKL